MTRTRQLHTALVAHKQDDSKIFFKLADLPTERRLRDVELLGSFAEVEVFRDSNEIADVTKFHGGHSIPRGAGASR